MLLMYHHPLCPFSRRARLALRECGIDFEMRIVEYWNPDSEFQSICVESQTPVIKDDKLLIVGNRAIDEFLYSFDQSVDLMGRELKDKIEILRLTEWFDVKFFYEVSKYIIKEKLINILTNTQMTNSNALRAARQNLKYHIQYIEFLTSKNNYLYASHPVIVDFAAAAQLSVIDYLENIHWDECPNAKNWYSMMKSRPSFRPLLRDVVHGLPPSKNYSIIDI